MPGDGGSITARRELTPKGTNPLAACLALLLRSGAMSVMALLAVCLSMGLWAADDKSRR